MGKFKLLQVLAEELLEENRKSEYVHYTDFSGLLGILEKKVLLARDYSDKAVDDDNALEVSMLRRSVDSDIKHSKNRKENLKNLSANIGGVKIYLIDKKIVSSVRGVSKKPISELYRFYSKEAEKSALKLIKNLEKDYKKKITAKELSDFVRKELPKMAKTKEEIMQVRKNLLKPETQQYKYIVEKFENAFAIDVKDDWIPADIADYARDMIWVVFGNMIGREGEERMVFKGLNNDLDETGIPLNPQYMKIKIEDYVTVKEVFDDLYENMKDFKRLYGLIISNMDMFHKNDKFKSFIKELKTAVETGALSEEVNAGPEVSQSEVVHYTNIEGLYGILHSGFINPQRYSVDALTDANKESDPWTIHTRREIATLRRGIAKEYTSLKKQNKDRYESNLSSLTSNAGKIKIYLFNKNITSKLRGVTKRPIAEFGKGSLQTFNDGVESLYVALSKTNENLKYDDLKKYLKKMGREISNWSIENSNTYVKSNAPIVKEKIDKMIIDLNLDVSKIEHKETDLYGRIFHLINNLIFFYTGKTREGEERLTFKDRKIEGIPVSPEFMKIKITDPITVKEIDNALFYSNERDKYLDKLEGFKDSLIKYKDSFIINSHYNELLSAIDEDIDKTRKRKWS